MKKNNYIKYFLIIITILISLNAGIFTASASGSDAVYDSMTLPSESRSDYMIKAYRNHGKILNDATSPKSKRVLSIGSIYPTSGVKLTDNFSIYLGRITLFAYSLSRGKWIIIDTQPYPQGIYLYTLPWQQSSSTKCSNVYYTDNYARIDLTAKDLNSSVLHFWGKSAAIDKTDYLFYACAYKFWVSDSAAGKLTAVNGIDTKDATAQKTIVQLYSSRGLSCTTAPKIMWGHTVPVSEYKRYKTSKLNKLYNKKKIEPNIYTGSGKQKNELIDPRRKSSNIKTLESKSKGSINITWNKISSYTTGYQIQYSYNKSFQDSQIITIHKVSKVKKKISDLISKKDCFVRIRTYKQIGTIRVYSKWSKKKKIKIS